MFRVLILIALAAPGLSQWIADCGLSQYPDAAQGQEWTVAAPPARIVGGVEARPNEFPWQVSLAYTDGGHFCGGSVLNANYIITASHCAEGMLPSELQAWVARTRIVNTADGIPFDIEAIIEHEGYNGGQLINDITLLRTVGSMPTDDTVRGICAPIDGYAYPDNEVTVSGWGTTTSGGVMSPTLLYTNVFTMRNPDCESVQGYNGVTTEMICTAVNVPERDSCQGDSGGPLFYNNGGSFQLVGIVSWGIGCATNPGVYTRVTQYLSWIATNAV